MEGTPSEGGLETEGALSEGASQMEGTPSEGGLETEGAPARLMWSKSYVIKINVQNNHCTQYLMPANKPVVGLRDPGTLSLQVIGTLGPCPFRLSGPWDLVPSGSWDHGTLSLAAIGTLGPSIA